MKSDFDFIKEKLQGEKTALPASLTKENIVKRVETEVREKKKSRIRRFVPLIASVAAVFVILAVFTAVKIKGSRPRVYRHEPTGIAIGQADKGDSYAEIGKLLKKNRDAGKFQWNFMDGALIKSSVASDAAEPEDLSGDGSIEKASGSSEYSERNTVVAGVDEADFIRTDGRYIYVLKNAVERGPISYLYGYLNQMTELGYGGQTFTVVDTRGGAPEKRSETVLNLVRAGDTQAARERRYSGFYLYENYVCLVGTETSFEGGVVKYNEEERYWDYYGDLRVTNTALITVYDLTDPASPVLLRDLYFDGSFLSTRLIDGKLVSVCRYAPQEEIFDAEDYTTFVPRCGGKDNFIDASDITVVGDDPDVFATVSVTDLSDASFSTRSIAVLGNSYDIYCSKNNVYIYGEHTRYYEEDGWTDVLTVSKTDVSGLTPVFVASADIEKAYVMNDYALDEYEGRLRLALHDYGNWTDRVNYVVVLDEEMRLLGRSEDFGRGEDIRSVRFSGDMVYVVTFLNTDPLFAVDLSDPKNPVIRGELKLPGYSSYMHPAGEGLMVGIGYDGDETGINGNGKISLFDVTDPENPKEIDRLILENAYLDSDYKTILTRDNGFFVKFRKYDSDYSSSREGMVYFTVEDGKLIQKSLIILDQSTNTGRMLFIGDVLYYYAVSSRETFFIENDQGWETHYYLYSYDLNTGEKTSQLEL